MAFQRMPTVPAGARAHAPVPRTGGWTIEGCGASPKPLQESFDPCPTFPHVSQVEDYGRLRAIGRLRTAQHVGSGRAHARSDSHGRGDGLDLCDFTGAVNLCTHDGSDLTAALRISLLVEHRPDRGRAALAVCARFRGLDERATLVCTRLVRAPGHCGGHLQDLIGFVAIRAGAAGYRHCLVPAPERLVPFLSRLGLTRTGQATRDVDDGRLLTMVLNAAPALTRPRTAPPVGA